MKKHPDKRLTAVSIRNAAPGRIADGNGLYLHTDESGAQRWILRTVIKGKRHELGLGSVRLVGLKDAREEAARLRRMARTGGDPLEQRRREGQVFPSFEEAAREAHKAHSATFRNEKHKVDWLSSLQMYAFPFFGGTPINEVESKDILEALLPIWTKKAETARRVKQRIKTVFDFAKAKGWRPGDNPADSISGALPRNGGGKTHFAALPYAEVPEFIQALHNANVSISTKLGFELLILTATRTGELVNARWEEIDLDAGSWTIPAERMKAKAEHRIPLSPRCLEILKKARELGGGDHVFPGRNYGRPLSNMSFLMTLRRMGRPDITAHGFRSSFRNWAEERTVTQHSVVEAALAHTVKNKVEAAYLRTTLFEKRIRLMEAWAAFATAKPAEKVVKMRGRA